MTRLASIIDTYKTEFLAQFRHRLSPDHLRALAAIQRCRTQASLRFPRQTGHPFHGKLDTDSRPNWTAVPAQTGH
jgi:hypothetical protein